MAKRLSVLKSGRKRRNVIKAMGSQARTAAVGRELCGHQPRPRRLPPAPGRGLAWGTWPSCETAFEVCATAPKAGAPSSPLLSRPTGAPCQSLGACTGEDCDVTPFLHLISASPLSHGSLCMVIFSSRYFPQANFSVTFHPFLSVSGCYFLPSRCLLFQIFSPSAFPHAPSLWGTAGRELSVGLGMENRQRLAVLLPAPG